MQRCFSNNYRFILLCNGLNVADKETQWILIQMGCTALTSFLMRNSWVLKSILSYKLVYCRDIYSCDLILYTTPACFSTLSIYNIIVPTVVIIIYSVYYVLTIFHLLYTVECRESQNKKKKEQKKKKQKTKKQPKTGGKSTVIVCVSLLSNSLETRTV